MYLKLNKSKEDNETVFYSVETTVKDQQASEHVLKVVKGLCIFNKKNEELTFDISQTDPFFLLRRIEFAYILYRLKQFNKSNQGFPNLFDIATG